MIEILLNNILPFVIILTVLVFVHELGHYLAALKNGVEVEVFLSVLVKRFLDLLIEPELDGNFRLFH